MNVLRIPVLDLIGKTASRLRFMTFATCALTTFSARCDVSMHFQFVFGPNPARAKNMRAQDLFDSALDIDLAKACAKGDANRMQSLMAVGGNVNCQGRKGMTPLFWALIHQNLPGFKYLLDHGADPNAVVKVTEPAPENALTLAASLDNCTFLEELLAHGANPNAPVGSGKRTPIFTASFYRRTKGISVLLRNGADIDWKDVGSITPLHDAVSGGSFEMALFLYGTGANPLIKDKWGYSPIDTIKQFGDRGIVSRVDKRAYKQLLEEFKRAGLLERK